MPATIRDVAKAAGVSIATVSNYLNETKTISPATRSRIEKSIAGLEFVPNSASRVMRGQRSPAIGYVVPDGLNPFFAEVARGVEDAALRAGYVIVTCNTEGDPERERRYLTALAEMRVMGVLITPTDSATDQLDVLRRGGASVVMLDHPSPDSQFSSVVVDDVAGGRMAMDHLLELGHRDILFIGGPGREDQVQNRLFGARGALESAGLDPDSLGWMSSTGTTAIARAEVGERLLQLPTLPTALICANDLIALAVQSNLARNGIRAPDDISIVGYDDIDHAQLAEVPLTTIRQPMYELGNRAARMLFEPAGDIPESHQFTPALVVRSSTGAPALRDPRKR